METSIMVAIISTSANIIVAALSFPLNKMAERRIALQQRKATYYRELLNALSDLAVDGTDKEKANQRFANAANNIVLVALQYLIEALMRFHDEVKFSNPTKSQEDRAFKALLLSIRKILELPFWDYKESFDQYHIESSPK
jgi:hypothetical protein